VKKFSSVIQLYGIEKILNWKDGVKLKRMNNLLFFCQMNNINRSYEVREFLSITKNRDSFLKINGVGYKTLDYLLKLLSSETIAVDRHIFSFVSQAGIESNDYYFVKAVVEYAADFMNVSRRTIDHSIWIYMSGQGKNEQLKLVY
jgi:endonuclease III-like uncharacterized protein